MRNIPQTVVATSSSDDDLVIFGDLDIKLAKLSMQSSSHSWSMEIRDVVFNSSRTHIALYWRFFWQREP